MKVIILNENEIAKFVITYIADTIDKMTENIIDKYGNLPLVFAGGVMSNTIINERISIMHILQSRSLAVITQ